MNSNVSGFCVSLSPPESITPERHSCVSLHTLFVFPKVVVVISPELDHPTNRPYDATKTTVLKGKLEVKVPSQRQGRRVRPDVRVILVGDREFYQCRSIIEVLVILLS